MPALCTFARNMGVFPHPCLNARPHAGMEQFLKMMGITGDESEEAQREMAARASQVRAYLRMFSCKRSLNYAECVVTPCVAFFFSFRL